MKKPLPRTHLSIDLRAHMFMFAAVVMLLFSFQHASAQTQFTAHASIINGTSEPFCALNYVANGNFTVTVEDGPDCTTPTFTVNASPVGGSGPGGSTPPFTIITTYIGFPNGSFFYFANAGAGTYTVTVTGTNVCSPTFTTNPVVFQVIVPEGLISCPEDIVVGNDPGECGAIVDYDPCLTIAPVTLTYSFEFDGSVVDSGSGTGSGSTFPGGTTLVTLTAENSDGIASCTFAITVEDTEGPVVLNAASLDETFDCKGQVPAPNPDILILDDNCSNSFTVTWAPDIITNGDCLHNYTIHRIYTISDGNGNETRYTQTFTIDDQIAPELVGVLPLGGDLGNVCEPPAPMIDSEMAALYADNCVLGEVTATLIGEDYSGDVCGWVVTYTYTVSDICGNTVTPVIVYSGGNTTPPIVDFCPGYQNKLVDKGACTFTVPDDSWDAVFVEYCSGIYINGVNLAKNGPIGNVLTATYTLSGATTGAGTSLVSVTFNLGVTEVVWSAVDDCGNPASCTFTVTVKPRSLSGIVSYYKYDADDLPIEGVLVRLMDGAAEIASTYTDADGKYSFGISAQLEDANRIEVSTNIPHGGLSSGDALAVSLREVGNDPSYWSPVKFLDHVGDVYIGNSHPDLNTIDAFVLFQRHVGIIDEFEGIGDWAFYSPADKTIFTNSSANTAYRMYNMGFCELDISVRTYGDVRGTYNPVGPTVLKSLTPIQSDKVMHVLEGETFELPVTIDHNISYNAVSFYLDYASDKIDVLEVKSDMPGMTAMIGNGTIRIEWYDLASQSLAEGDAFITLIARTKAEVTPGDLLFNLGSATEFVDATAQTIPDVEVSVSSLNTVNAITGITDPNQLGVSLEAYPNPFRDELNLRYVLPEAGHVRISLVNMLGSEVASLVDMRQDAGTYTHNWTPESMEFGVYFVRFEVQAETTSTSRLVKLIYMR